MFKTITQIKKYSFFCFLSIISACGCWAQDNKTIPDIEKIYLHTDNSRYFVGDDLYYKAYNVRANNNLLFDNSNILYVELISPDAKIIARNKTNLEMGLGNGDFQLSDSLGVKPGVYQLRAYTNWNRNFGEDFVFKKNIEIIDVFESHSKTNKTQNGISDIKTTEISKQNNFKIDFFPEGGSLLLNVTSVVGFKAVDSKGYPINVTGEIFDSDNELVTSFSSTHDGMGKFQIIPIEGKNYYAKTKFPDTPDLRTELPGISKSGYSLNYKVVRGKSIIAILTNEQTLLQNPNAALTVVCSAKGVAYFESLQTVTQTVMSFELPKEITPEGISQITLYDSNLKPLSERLIYIEKEQDLEVQLSTDKVSYQPNEKATVNVISKSKTGIAKSASFSLSVTDMNGVTEEKDFGTTISSYFLMESDIRGKVYNPGYYFDTANLKRLDHLENLLLTQGWRDFVWKTTPGSNDNIKYMAEKGFTIAGRVKQLFGDKAKVNNRIGMVLMNKKHMNSFKTYTDSIGSFKFENIMFSGKTKMSLYSRNEKGKYSGEIIVNPIEQPPLAVFFKNETINRNESTTLIVENVFKKYTSFGVKPENMLAEVSIAGKKKPRSISHFGIPDASYVADKDMSLFTNIYELIEQKIAGVVSFEDSVRFVRYEAAPLFVINGMAAFKEEVDAIYLGDIERIDAIKGSQAKLYFGDESSNGIIAIYTNPNAGNRSKNEYFHSIQQEVDGFYMARVFYSPDPEKISSEDNKLAVRNTLYWNPYVHPDKAGNANVNYYNTKVETKIRVALEGITGSGIPVVKNAYYIIKK
ncbi:hypothetical protein DMB65_08010 [Flavobacterium cheongpyeongense]|uniref:Macroglobulin domain-containing protein n=1 Tax=Flavobacterium cheongpyeongense TaxID=2212651 RepID=A0A2V4BQN3_9FLAO|nr:hypothetical protein [Flavobacterium cheongpyeongense]PXY41338.1 hypothetical protein DMB65_08010 [Flavobacterium cheongpyeongense]